MSANELTLDYLKNKWSEYAVLIQESKKSKDAETPFSVLHYNFGKQKFASLEEIEKWLELNEIKLAECAGIPPKNLLVQKYKEREKILEEKARQEKAKHEKALDLNPQVVKPEETFARPEKQSYEDIHAEAIAGILDDDGVFESEKFLDIPEGVREVLSKPNNLFYTSKIKADQILKEKLHSPTLAEAKAFPVIVGILKESGLELSDEPDRFELSILLAELGFSVRYFGDPRITPSDQVLLCVAGSS